VIDLLRQTQPALTRILLATLVGLIPSMTAEAEDPWSAEGPAPLLDGQVEGITDKPVSGGINAVAAHPTDANILYTAGVNGGIWKTTTATAASPSWTHQTNGQVSQSIGTVAFDPTDGTHQTLVAGIGRFSSFSGRGGSRTGLLRTTNGGSTWSAIDGGMAGRNVVGVAPRGATIVAAVNTADTSSCSQFGIFRSVDTGATWGRAAGIPNGRADALGEDPTDSSILYASVVLAGPCSSSDNGIYKSTDTGATWSKVSTAAMEVLLTDSSSTNVDIAVGQSNNVFVSLIPVGGRLGGVFRSGNGGTTWTQMDLPGTMELPGPGFVGLHPGRQGGTHSSLAADPADANVVYIGGDRQPRGFEDMGSFPNAVGAVNFTGRLFRGDASLPVGSQFTALTHSGTASNSAPHADSRGMAFDADGNLLEVDDGGIYKRTLPTSSTGDWFSLNSNIRMTESHDLAYDSVSDILMVGNQDTGTGEQIAPGSATWDSVLTADGGDVVIDSTSTSGVSTRYSSVQNLGGFRRRVYNASNVLLSQVVPARTVIGGGAPFSPQFVTPLALNHMDPTRMILGGSNSVYESLDQADTIEEIGVDIVVRSSGRNAISAGATGNIDVLYIGGCIGSCSSSADGLDGVYVRTTSGGALSHSLTTASSVQGVAGDPEDPTEAFAMDSATVHYTANTGASWTDVTGNLATFDPGTLRSITYGSNGTSRALTVGADRGVYIAQESSGFTTWSSLGTGLPKIPIWELEYDDSSDTLYAGLLGQGAFSLTPVLGPPSFSLTVTLAGAGSGSVSSSPTGISCPIDCTEDYVSGTVVTLTPTAAADSTFTAWVGDPDCFDGEVVMDAARNCTAEFSRGLLFGDGFESGDTTAWTTSRP